MKIGRKEAGDGSAARLLGKQKGMVPHAFAPAYGRPPGHYPSMMASILSRGT